MKHPFEIYENCGICGRKTSQSGICPTCFVWLEIADKMGVLAIWQEVSE